MLRLVLRLAFCVLVPVAAAPACRAMSPANGPDSTCQAACRERAASVCNNTECGRGCNLVLDRIIEHEGNNVVACVSRSTRGCTDTVWAECAARVGPRADGGPPPPVTETFPDED